MGDWNRHRRAGWRGGGRESNHDHRLTRLEGIVSGLAQDMQELATDVKTLVVELGKTRQTDWRTIGTYMGVALALAVALATVLGTFSHLQVDGIRRELEGVRREEALRQDVRNARDDELRAYVDARYWEGRAQ